MVTTFFAEEVMGVVEWYAPSLWIRNVICAGLLDALSPALQVILNALDFLFQGDGSFP